MSRRSAASRGNRLVADSRIFGDAALETAGAVAARADLAHEVHRHRGREALGSGPGGKFGRRLGHHGDDERASGPDADEAADRGGEPGTGGIGSDDAEPRLCARDGDHLAERRVQSGFVDQAGIEVMGHRFGRRRRRSLPSRIVVNVEQWLWECRRYVGMVKEFQPEAVGPTRPRDTIPTMSIVHRAKAEDLTGTSSSASATDELDLAEEGYGIRRPC